MERYQREPSKTDFHVDVDGIGHFVFARRVMRDELRISAEYSRLTEGLEKPTNWLDSLAGWMATLKVLIVTAPHSWDPEEMDPFDDETEEKILKVYAALRAKESSFRKAKGAGSEASGKAEGETT